MPIKHTVMVKASAIGELDYYDDNGRPSCLIGHVNQALGGGELETIRTDSDAPLPYDPNLAEPLRFLADRANFPMAWGIIAMGSDRREFDLPIAEFRKHGIEVILT